MPPSVQVERLTDYPAFVMIWQQQINRDDIDSAKATLMQLLDMSRQPQYVIVDLHLATDFLLSKTIASVLLSVYVHRNVEEMLLCGSDEVTRILKRTLDLRSGLSSSRRFEAWAAVLDYLDEQLG